MEATRRLAPREPPALLTLGLALTTVTVTAARAQGAQEVRIRTTDVAPGVYMLEGRGGNIGVSAGEDGVFMIDDQYAPLTDRIMAAIRRFSDGPIRFVINTHWHDDHTGGNENLGEAGAIIVAHENVRKRLSTDQFIEAFEREYPAAPEGALPVITFSESVTFHLNDDELQAVHVASAHTDGDAIIFFESADVVHMGDVYFNGRYPFIDVSSGGSVDGVIEAVTMALARIGDETRVIPGHGALSNRAELRAYRKMLVTVRDRVRTLIADGRSREEVIAAKPTATYDAELGDGSDPGRFVGILYDDLSRGER